MSEHSSPVKVRVRMTKLRVKKAPLLPAPVKSRWKDCLYWSGFFVVILVALSALYALAKL